MKKVVKSGINKALWKKFFVVVVNFGQIFLIAARVCGFIIRINIKALTKGKWLYAHYVLLCL